MESRMVIRSQYLAALEMLKQAVMKCPAAVWNHPEDKSRTWQIAYHALFYLHLYLQTTRDQFKPWAKHHPGWERWSGDEQGYSPGEILEYLALCQQQVNEKTADLDLEAESGFHWLPFNKLELQIYNIRHLQQHTGELMERLGTWAQIDVDWVSLKYD